MADEISCDGADCWYRRNWDRSDEYTGATKLVLNERCGRSVGVDAVGPDVIRLCDVCYQNVAVEDEPCMACDRHMLGSGLEVGGSTICRLCLDFVVVWKELEALELKGKLPDAFRGALEDGADSIPEHAEADPAFQEFVQDLAEAAAARVEAARAAKAAKKAAARAAHIERLRAWLPPATAEADLGELARLTQKAPPAESLVEFMLELARRAE